MSKPPERRGDRLYWTPACPIVAQNFNNAADPNADTNGSVSDPTPTVGWTLDRSKVPNAVYFAMKSHRIKAQTLGGEGVWRSAVVNISGYTGIQVDAKISSEGSFSSSEYVKVSYILDGGPETLIGEYTGAFGTPLVTSAQMTGSTVQIVIRMYNVSAGNNDYYIEQYDVFKETGPCTVSSGISVSASASNSGVLTCANPSTTLSASTTASGTTTYSWTGPSGFTATGTSVTATTAGTYTVTGTNSSGTGTASVTVTSNTTAPAGLTATASGVLTCAVSGITLTASSTTSGVTYAWTGPNSYSNTGASVTANMAGTYTVTATNPATGCTASTTVAVTANTTNPTNITPTVSGPLTCSATSVTLSGSSSLSNAVYTWAGPGGFTASGATAAASTAGAYTLTATNPTTGCWGSTSINVTSNTTPPAGVTATASGSLTCSTTSVTLTGTSTTTGATFAWSGPGGFTATGATATATAAGTYTVTATNPATGCTATAATTVTQNLTAPAGVTASNNGPLTCSTTSATLSGSSTTTSGVTYAWTGPSGFTASGATATTTTPGAYTLTATYTPTGCTSTGTTTVISSTTPPAGVTATASGSLTCTATSVTLTGASTTSGTTFAWSGPGGFTATGATAAVTAAGTYTLTATNPASGCTATASVTVTGNTTAPAGVAIATSNNNTQLTCSTNFITVLGSSTTSGATYSWSGPNNFNAASAAANVFNPGTYTLTVTNPTDGCTSTAHVVITQNATPPAGVAITPNLATLTCANPSATLTGSSSTAGVSYAWSGPNSFTATGTTTTVISAGEYILTVTDPTNGCTSTTAATISANFTAPANLTAVNNGPQTCYNVYPTLTGSSTTTGTTYAWTGPNGFTATGATANVTSFGQGGGTYTLTATNPANGCTAITTTVVAVDINAPTGVNVVSSAASPVLNCTNPSLRLTASSSTPGVTYAWRIGPTGSTVLGTGDTLTVTQPNQYDVLVQNPENGCAFLGGITVSQNVTAPANLLLTSNPAAGVLTCTTTSIACNANASGSKVGYTWTGPGGFSFYGQTTNLSVPGTYSVTAMDSTDGCTSTASTTITQDITPPSAVTIGSATGTTIINCTNPTLSLTAGSSPNTASYSWSGPNNYSSNNATASVTVPGTYIVTATLASNGCSKTANVLIALDTASPAGITTSSVPANATLTCTNPNVVLTGSSATSGVTYNWTGPNNFAAPGSSVTVATPGNYVVTVTNPVNGCSSAVTASAVTQNVTIPIGVSTITSNKLSCNVTKVSVTANSSTTGATYTWTGPQGFTANTRVISATLGGAYTVTVTNPDNGCTTSKTATVVADTATPAGVTATNSGPLTCTTTTVTLTGNSTTAGVTYTWNGPNGFFDPEQVSTSATDSGAYILTVNNPGNGCITNDTTYVSADFSECTAVTPKVTAAKASTFNDSATAGAFTYQVFPNPTGNTAVSITFHSPTAANVIVAVYNNAGVQERVLFSNAVEANQNYRLTLNPGGLGSGIHYCQIRVNDKVYTTKLLVLPN